MKCHGMAANQQIINACVVETFQEVAEVFA
jgi:hypothetical protein